MLEGAALAFVSGADDPVTGTPPSRAVASLAPPTAEPEEAFALRASRDGPAPEPAVRSRGSAPGTTLDDPNPFSERSADAWLAPVCEPPDPDDARVPGLVAPAAFRFGAASTRA